LHVHPLLSPLHFQTPLWLVALTDVVALLDAGTLAAAGVGVAETKALLVLALGEVSDLLSALKLVRVL
jgi:hypothetical protein